MGAGEFCSWRVQALANNGVWLCHGGRRLVVQHMSIRAVAQRDDTRYALPSAMGDIGWCTQRPGMASWTLGQVVPRTAARACASYHRPTASIPGCFPAGSIQRCALCGHGQRCHRLWATGAEAAGAGGAGLGGRGRDAGKGRGGGGRGNVLRTAHMQLGAFVAPMHCTFDQQWRCKNTLN